MAFSYSDKNFTVVGNLCFTHISLTKAGYGYMSIPSAIVERMLIKEFRFNYVSLSADGASAAGSTAVIKNGLVEYTNPKDTAYMFCYFPIDSNK